MKTYQNYFLFLFFVSAIYLFPIFFLGAERMEDYLTTHLTLKIIAENLYSPFIFYYDLYGPGSNKTL